MNAGLTKKYTLSTAIAMVVGIVIGSGVFFKAEKILIVTGGNVMLSVTAWALGGLIMLICTYAFSILAGRYESVGGLVDYAEALVGKRYSYFVGWFMCLVYYPTLAAAVAWVAARYFCLLIGWQTTGGTALSLSAFFMISAFTVNALSPVLAGKIQIVCTIIKLIPLLLMGLVGTVSGLTNGILIQNIKDTLPVSSIAPALAVALPATAFAYDGWIVATSINAELKNAKRNLPLALLAGSLIVIVAYIFYCVGLSGAIPKEDMMQMGEAAVYEAFNILFTPIGSTLLLVFIMISCLGTLNGLMLGNARGLYALAIRQEGPSPHIFIQLDKATNVPVNSAIWGLFVSIFWLLYYTVTSLNGTALQFGFDITELPAVTMYAAYIPIFIMMTKKERQLTAYKRFFIPACAIISCLFMITSAWLAHRDTVHWYVIAFGLIMFIGALFRSSPENRSS
ncbi:MAG: APC family permease [Ruminococcaceae bacterium]|nr:APC family permease [Oscillospiraceae bacterium]